MATKPAAIVTGGGQGIGKAITKALLKEQYKVGILDINEAAGKQTEDEFSSEFGSQSCVFLKCDVMDSEQLKDCYDRIEKTLGDVGVVVNNAGIGDKDFKKCVDVNLKAVIDLSNISLAKLGKDKGGNGGTIVNISSIAGLQPLGIYPAYTATKWGIIGFTRSMAEHSVQHNCEVAFLTLCPGATADTQFEARTREGVQRKNFLYDLSPDELATEFMTLLKERRNGAVMLVTREKKDGPVETRYLENKWNPIQF